MPQQLTVNKYDLQDHLKSTKLTAAQGRDSTTFQNFVTKQPGNPKVWYENCSQTIATNTVKQWKDDVFHSYAYKSVYLLVHTQVPNTTLPRALLVPTFVISQFINIIPYLLSSFVNLSSCRIYIDKRGKHTKQQWQNKNARNVYYYQVCLMYTLEKMIKNTQEG